jgi:hypothetical protein
MFSFTPREDGIIVRDTKNRDEAERPPIAIKKCVVGASCIVERGTTPAEKAAPLSERARTMLDALGGDRLTGAAWRKRVPDIPKRSFYRILNAELRPDHPDGMITRVGEVFSASASQCQTSATGTHGTQPEASVSASQCHTPIGVAPGTGTHGPAGGKEKEDSLTYVSPSPDIRIAIRCREPGEEG